MKQEFTENILMERYVPLRFDKENRILREVTVLKRKSLNNRIYEASALNDFRNLIAEAESSGGIKAFKQHSETATPMRDPENVIGTFHRGQSTPSIVQADLHYMRHHSKFVEGIVEAAVPRLAFSAHIRGEGVRGTDGTLERVFNITKIHSIDLVVEAATAGHFFENLGDIGQDDKIKLDAIEEEIEYLEYLGSDNLTPARAERKKKIDGLVYERSLIDNTFSWKEQLRQGVKNDTL